MHFSPRRDAGLTSEGVVLLLIGTAVVAVVVWLAYTDNESMEASARRFAEETVHHLAVAHEGAYLARHLSASGRMQMTPGQQERALAGLRSLGAAAEPFEIEGTTFDGPDPGDHGRHGRFEAQLRYPLTRLEVDLEIAYRNGRWQIDNLVYFSAGPSARAMPPPR